MAQIRSLSHGNLKIQFESTTTPGTYVTMAAITEKQFVIDPQTQDQFIPDDTDADLATFLNRIVTAIGFSLTGKGVMALADRLTWTNWALGANTTSGYTKNIRIMFQDTGANGGGYIQAAAILSKLTFSSQRGDKVMFDFEIVSAGSFSLVANP